MLTGSAQARLQPKPAKPISRREPDPLDEVWNPLQLYGQRPSLPLSLGLDGSGQAAGLPKGLAPLWPGWFYQRSGVFAVDPLA